MTLTLDEVRRIRFPMARRPGEGYRAGEVDDFVDKVDATFAAIVDENDRLKAQLDALKNADGAVGGQADPKLAEENNHLKAQLEEFRSQAQGAGSAELERSRSAVADAENKLRASQQENSNLRNQLEETRRSASRQSAGQGAGTAELARLRTENERLNSQLQQARSEAEQARRSAATSGQGAPSGTPERIQVTTSAEAAPAVVRMVELAIADAERVVHEAQAEADRKMADAEKKAHEHIVDAQTRAERIESAARVNSERVTSEAQASAEKVTTDAQNRRNDLFAQLEAERDELAGKVDQLRSFETNYRGTIISHLRNQAENIEKGVFEPTATPDLLRSENRVVPGTSATPRLDALITGRSQQA